MNASVGSKGSRKSNDFLVRWSLYASFRSPLCPCSNQWQLFVIMKFVSCTVELFVFEQGDVPCNIEIVPEAYQHCPERGPGFLFCT